MGQDNGREESGRARIELARTKAFRLGDIDVSPATLELRREGQTQTLEPRVMQVLVALWRAGGSVVTRDDLIASCWDGRIVGDNAIQRPISRLRELAGGFASGCFRLETVNKVGYRLLGSDSETNATPILEGWRNRRTALICGAVCAAAGLAGLLIAGIGAPAPVAPTVVLVADQGSDAARMANGLAVDLLRLASGRPNAVVFENGSDRTRADHVLQIAGQTAGGRMQVDLSLFGRGSPDRIWSGAFARPVGETGELRRQIAFKLDQLENCAWRTGASGGDWARLRNILSGCDRIDDMPDEGAVKSWQRIVDDNPDSAAALAQLGFLESYLVSPVTVGTLRKPQMRARLAAARNHNEKALAMNGRLGTAYAAASLLLPQWRYRDTAAILDRGLALDPGCAVLHEMDAYALERVGRMNEAIVQEREAVALEPGSAWYRANLVSTLAYTGYTKEAATELRSGEQVWPASPALQETRWHFDLRFADPVPLVRAIDDGTQLQSLSIAESKGILRAFLVARARPTAPNIEFVLREAGTDRAPHFYLQALVAFGRIDDAFRVAEIPGNVAYLRSDGTNILFRANMHAFRRDRRFIALADRIGLVRYWQSTDSWPDFCDDKDLAYDCRTEASRLHPGPA